MVYKKTDGTKLYIRCDDIYPNCSWNDGPGSIEAFWSTFGQEILSNAGELAGKGLDLTKIVAYAAMALVMLYLIFSDLGQKVLKDLSK
jgi:hypothetical protein